MQSTLKKSSFFRKSIPIDVEKAWPLNGSVVERIILFTNQSYRIAKLFSSKKTIIVSL